MRRRGDVGSQWAREGMLGCLGGVARTKVREAQQEGRVGAAGEQHFRHGGRAELKTRRGRMAGGGGERRSKGRCRGVERR